LHNLYKSNSVKTRCQFRVKYIKLTKRILIKRKNYEFYSFYTVAAAKEYLANTENKTLKLFAEDHINNKGTLVKCYVVSTWKALYYLSTKHTTSFYEWIDGDVPVKLHLDVDCKEELFSGRSQQDALDYYLKESIEFVNTTATGQTEEGQVYHFQERKQNG
jgi:hypothetical protein